MIKILRIFTLIGILLLPQASLSTGNSVGNNDKYSFTFNGNSLRQFIMTVANIMDYTVSIDNRVKGKVNVRSYKLITKSELLDIFHNQIYMNGFVVLQKNKSLRIIPAELAKTQAETLVVRNVDELRNPEIHKMTVVTLSMQVDLNVKNVVNIVKPLLDQKISTISYYESGNNIIITDRKQNLLRVFDIIQELTLNSQKTLDKKLLTYKINYIDGKRLTQIVTTFIAKQTDEDLKTVSLFYEEDSNSIIVKGSQSGIYSIIQVIEKIDVQPMQVLVEAIILELESEDVADLGMDFIFGGLNKDQLAKGILISGGKINGSSWDGILKVLKANSNTNVLSTPSIITSSNKKAVFLSGREIPVITSESEDSNDKKTNTFKRKDVGINLTVTPKITEQEKVSMNISQEISSIDSLITAKDVVVKKRKISSSVIVPNGEILIIGGLYDEIDKQVKKGIPVLSDLPILENIFGSVKNVKQKRSLFILLRPTIVDDKNFKKQDELLKLKERTDKQSLEKVIKK